MPHSTDRYKAFAEAYLTPNSDTHFNICQSAILAGYSETYATRAGKGILETIGIKVALSELQKELDKSAVVAGPEQMLEILTRLLYFNPKSLLTDSGELKTLKQMDEDTAFCLTAIEVDRSGTLKYKWNDKVTVIKTIFDSLGLKNGNKELVDRVVEKIFNLNVQVNVGSDAAAEALKLLVTDATGRTKGMLPGQNVGESG